MATLHTEAQRGMQFPLTDPNNSNSFDLRLVFFLGADDHNRGMGAICRPPNECSYERNGLGARNVYTLTFAEMQRSVGFVGHQVAATGSNSGGDSLHENMWTTTCGLPLLSRSASSKPTPTATRPKFQLPSPDSAAVLCDDFLIGGISRNQSILHQQFLSII